MTPKHVSSEPTVVPPRKMSIFTPELGVTSASMLQSTSVDNRAASYASGRSTRSAVAEPRLTGHLPALDGLRGLAILLVLLRHFTEGAEFQSTSGRWLASALDAGWIGVDLFFVLSGFLITGILLEAKRSQHYFRNFYVRRTLRIFPLYYGVLAAVFCVAPWLGWLAPESGHNEHSQAWLWAYATNMIMSWTGSPLLKHGWVNLNHFWSLAVEEHFYLFWPLIVFTSTRFRLVAITVAAFVASFWLRVTLSYTLNALAPYILTPCRIDTLMLGALLAVAVREPGGIRALVRPARVVLSIGLVLLSGIFVLRKGLVFWDRLVLSGGFSLLSASFGALLVLTLAARENGALARTFTSLPLRFLGRYSYGIYVFHYLLLAWFERIFPVSLLAFRLGSYALGLAAHVLLCSAVAVTIAFASWHLYEKQFLKLKRFFEYRAPRRQGTDGECVAASGRKPGPR
jgi:peptidoglycan/LPS O-acetylase OafA/YrhL